MNEIEKTPGTKVQYQISGNYISFRDGDMTLNLANRERDEENIIDICEDLNGEIVIGVADGYKYLAQIAIPARSYTDTEGELDEETGETPIIPVAEPFDISKCTIYLWGGVQ
ncbi:hypothetical protein FACS18949_15290 [Clostridia bacterium]|nr:hypothetical protein FACS189425_08810 [Clostridia bacterium]GHV36184.1 hypothetical protein FACS18949_15290 [Clostridia bacterium]